MLHPLVLIVFGLLVGVFSGVMGLGGGSVMIPAMVLLLGMTQQQAHGTSLAVMIPPVTLPAVVAYYMTKNPDGSRNVDLRVAAWMAVGVLFGSYFGARFANSVPKETLKLIFGFVLVYVACYTIFGKEHLARSVFLSAAVVLVAMALYALTKVWDRNVAAAGGAPTVTTQVR
ncbi:MAG TPA: sulfite exporter TauE/SafE family protein [Tepidisphaeraceae bacterium]|nr:sulfite exporter TauE/SafE family protein [Tepidisphaeraceae bacterium]